MEETVKLQQQIQELSKRKLDSQNSHQPASKASPYKERKRKIGKKVATKCKSGGRKGHKFSQIKTWRYQERGNAETQESHA